ncbi:MAG: gamma-glutamyltransferase family protein [Caldilineaceae bacterium]
MTHSTFRSRRPDVYATNGMVAASHPLAAQVGLDMLKAGGTAADAAVAAAAMLNVVEPMMTGVGGDCFALYWDAQTKQVTALNGSGRAPAAASPTDVKALGYTRMPSSTGHTVTVPGTVAGWQDLLARHGRMSLTAVLQPAIRTAEQGFPVSQLVAALWAAGVAKLTRAPGWQSGDLHNGPVQASAQELLLDGRAPRPGELMRLPTLATTLRGIAEDGPAYFYEGEFAQKLCAHVQRYGGWLTPADLAAHHSTWDEPLTARYRDVTLYECPPNGQGLAAILAVNLANGFDLASMSEADRVHTMIECMRLGFADAQQWVADPRVVDLPLAALTSRAYADRRRQAIHPQRAAATVTFGELPTGNDTTYLTVVDGAGNACSFINSVAANFGCGLVVPGSGVVLQNRGANFALAPDHPNELAPNKRPYQTIIPAMTVYHQGPFAGELHASYGVMGGAMQPQGHFQVLVNLVELGLTPQPALDRPRWRLSSLAAGMGIQAMGATQGGGLVLVEEGWEFSTLAELAKRGHQLAPVTGIEGVTFGGGQVILRHPVTGVLTGGSEPRMDGIAVGW